MERIDCLCLEGKGPLITRFYWLRWLILIVNLNRLRITMETHLQMKLREMMFADMLNRGREDHSDVDDTAPRAE